MITTNGINWLWSLATSVSFAFLGLLVPNLYKQTRTPRPHNRAKFLNEFLARHLLVYTTYFAAIALTADFKIGYEWIRKSFAFGLSITFGFYLVAMYITIHQDTFFRAHGCAEFGGCNHPNTASETFRFCRQNLMMALVLASAGVLVTFAMK